jgi:hypothetical protein
MDIFIGAILAITTLIAAAYAHKRIPAFTNTRRKVIFTRLVLVLIGAAFGAVSSLYVAGTLQQLLTFLAAFGMVHVPAAVILLVKSKRGEHRS